MPLFAALAALFEVFGGLEIGVALGALVAVIAVYAGKESLAWLVRGISDNVPVIGGYIAGAINTIIGGILNYATAALDGMLKPARALLSVTGAAVAGLALELASFAGTVAGSIERITGEYIPRFVGAVAGEITSLMQTAFVEVNTVIGTVAKSVGVVETQVVAIEHQVVDGVVPAIDWIVGKAIPAINGEVADVWKGITDVIQPEIGALQQFDAAVWPVVAASAVGVAELAWFRQADTQNCLKNTCLRLPDIIDLLDNTEGALLMERILARANLTPTAALALLDSGFNSLFAAV